MPHCVNKQLLKYEILKYAYEEEMLNSTTHFTVVIFMLATLWCTVQKGIDIAYENW